MGDGRLLRYKNFSFVLILCLENFFDCILGLYIVDFGFLFGSD